MIWKKVASWVLCALLVVSTAMAAGNATLMGNYYQNATNGAVVDSAGNAKVVDADRDRDKLVAYTLISDTTSWGCADSTSAPFYTGNVGRGFLFIRVDTTFTVARFAVRVQAVTSKTDLTWGTVFNFRVNDDLTSSATASSDTLGRIDMADDYPKMDLIASSTEYIVNLRSDVRATNAKFGRYRGIVVPLQDKRGYWLWAPYMHVQIRLMNAINSAGANASTLPVTVLYRGTPL